jgi:hypothetical protein
MDRLQQSAKADARSRVTATRETDRQCEEFRKLIGALYRLDIGDLAMIGLMSNGLHAWEAFRRSPVDYFLALPDEMAVQLYALVKVTAR